MKIAYITQRPLSRTGLWSGTLYNLYNILKKDHEIIQISTDIWKGKRLENLTKKFTHSFDAQWHNFRMRAISKKINNSDADVVFAPVMSEELPYLHIEKPVIYLSDAVYKLMLNYYLFDVDKDEELRKDKEEQQSLVKADAVILSSFWGRDGAIDLYHISPDKVHVLPFGANIKDENIYNHDFNEQIIKLLFVGVDWERKGVQLALDAVRVLNSKNLDYRFEINIVGLTGKNEEYEDYIKFWGRLSKTDSKQYRQMIELYKESHIFILPTKAECSAIVFSEASMFGLPVFTHETGGVPTYVHDNKTGRCLPLGSTGTDFADAIEDALIGNKLSNMSVNARKLYEAELNWDKWLESFNKIAQSLID